MKSVVRWLAVAVVTLVVVSGVTGCTEKDDGAKTPPKDHPAH